MEPAPKPEESVGCSSETFEHGGIALSVATDCSAESSSSSCIDDGERQRSKRRRGCAVEEADTASGGNPQGLRSSRQRRIQSQASFTNGVPKEPARTERISALNVLWQGTLGLSHGRAGSSPLFDAMVKCTSAPFSSGEWPYELVIDKVVDSRSWCCQAPAYLAFLPQSLDSKTMAALMFLGQMMQSLEQSHQLPAIELTGTGQLLVLRLLRHETKSVIVAACAPASVWQTAPLVCPIDAFYASSSETNCDYNGSCASSSISDSEASGSSVCSDSGDSDVTSPAPSAVRAQFPVFQPQPTRLSKLSDPIMASYTLCSHPSPVAGATAGAPGVASGVAVVPQVVSREGCAKDVIVGCCTSK